jgi:hypothetical protein
MKVQEYVIDRNYTVTIGPHYGKVLPAGSFIKPIDKYYLPDYIKKSIEYLWLEFDYTYCYTYYGMILVSNNLIRSKD